MLKKICICIIVFCLFLESMCLAKVDNFKTNSTAILAYERNTKSIVYEKNGYNILPMASTTKIMTAIITLEYAKLNEVVIVTENAQNTGGWELKLKKGDKILLIDLLNVILLYSANDAAVAIAEHIGGSVENFCQMMNNKAKEIGANNTNFTSPHGLDDDNHYSTCYDLALIMNYALNLPQFVNIISTESYICNISGYQRQVSNTNKLLHKAGTIGGKTGYTGNAMYCLVNNIKKEGIDLITVVLGAQSSEQRFEESSKLSQYLFDNLELYDLSEYIKDKIYVKAEKGEENSAIGVVQKNKCMKYMLKSKEKNIKTEYILLNKIVAPVKEGEKVGIASIYIGDKKICSYSYFLEKEYLKNTWKEYIKVILHDYMLMLKIN